MIVSRTASRMPTAGLLAARSAVYRRSGRKRARSPLSGRPVAGAGDCRHLPAVGPFRGSVTRGTLTIE